MENISFGLLLMTTTSLFGPSNYWECYQVNMNEIESIQSIKEIRTSCRNQFPDTAPIYLKQNTGDKFIDIKSNKGSNYKSGLKRPLTLPI